MLLEMLEGTYRYDAMIFRQLTALYATSARRSNTYDLALTIKYGTATHSENNRCA